MRYWIAVIFFVLGHFVVAQDTLLYLPGVRQFQVDPLGQLVYQDVTGRLFRLDRAADTLYAFDNNLLGEITYVDVSNPFGPLVYFADFELILLLDRTLNEINRFDYRSSNITGSGRAVARNFDNGIWLYDLGDFRLKRIDPSGRIDQRSDDLSRLLNTFEPPHQLIVQDGKLYAYFPGRGIAVFSNYGRFLHWRAEDLAVETILPDQRGGVGWYQKGLYYLLAATDQRHELPLPTAGIPKDRVISAQPQADYWLILSNEGLIILK